VLGTRRVSIRDVASAAGVSIGTVSRVLNDHNEVSPASRERVRAAIAQLGYQPSQVGRALSKRVIAVVGVLVPDMTDPVFMPMVQGIESVASKYGFAVMLSNSDRMPARELQFGDLMAQFGVSGAVVVGGGRQNDRELAARLGAIPTVVVARPAANGIFPSAAIDHCTAARLAVEHLLDLGHRRIGTVRGDPTSEAGTERLRGYREALRLAGVESDPALVVGRSFDLANGIGATSALLDLAEPPTAIFYASDEMALGGLRAIKDRGLRIPADLSVASVNDIPFAATSDPPLTTVRMPAREMGMLGMQMLSDLIDRREPVRDVVLSVELVVRQSTAPPVSR
jgi:DNA-binding LacI/PurR family transcriptional regulator